MTQEAEPRFNLKRRTFLKGLVLSALAPSIRLLPSLDEIKPIEWGETDRPEIALTFDGGAGSEPTPKILRELRKRHLQVSMYLAGLWILNNISLVEEIIDDGHHIENHSYDHIRSFRDLVDPLIVYQLQETDNIFYGLSGGISTKPYVRPPFGGWDRRVGWVCNQAGWDKQVLWTRVRTQSGYWITGDSGDWVTEPVHATPESVKRNILAAASLGEPGLEGHGVITVQHLGSPETAAALPEILDILMNERGLQIVTVPRLLTPTSELSNLNAA